MQRYFASKIGENVFLSEGDEHHFLHVMRGKKGEIIEAVAGGCLYSCRAIALAPLTFAILDEEKLVEGPKSHLSLAFSLLKHENDELVYEKGTELGVQDFYPFLSSRTIIHVRDGDEKEKKLARAAKIVKNASEQSKRSTLPVIHPISSFEDILLLRADLKLFAYEERKGDVGSFENSLESLPLGGECLIVIGPEGGFSVQEASSAKTHGFQYVSLGERILRAETASIYAASVFSFVEERSFAKV